MVASAARHATGLDEFLGDYAGSRARGETPGSHSLDESASSPYRALLPIVLTEFYRLHGWDANGQPTREGLERVGLGDTHESMKGGAASEEGRGL